MKIALVSCIVRGGVEGINSENLSCFLNINISRGNFPFNSKRLTPDYVSKKNEQL
jgi:hypothetical protein